MNGKTLIPSDPLESNPDWMVVTDCDHFGHGWFSVHVSLVAAQHNAAITGGRVVPIEYVNGGMMMPPYAAKVMANALSKADIN